MAALTAIFKIRFICSLQYRVPALAGVATQFFWGGVTLMIYLAFYESNPAVVPMPFAELASYIWIQQAFIAVISIWSWDRDLGNMIVNGNIAYELCRPQDVYSFWFMKMLATRIAAAGLRCLPVLVLAALLPEPYGIRFPDAGGMLLFIPALTFAAVLNTAIIMLAVALMFFTLTPAIASAVSVLFEFLSGFVVPLPLLPDIVRKTAYLLPFRYGADLPFRIFSGNIAGLEAGQGIALQLFWIAILLLAGKFTYARALRRVVVQGG